MGFYTILNTGQLAGDSLLSPGAPVNNCRWASVSLVKPVENRTQGPTGYKKGIYEPKRWKRV